MKKNLHLTKKKTFTILLNKASYQNGFILRTRKKVMKHLITFYSSIDAKVAPLQKKNVFEEFHKKYNWGFF